MKCTKCGHEGSRAVFRYVGPVDVGVRNSIRQCPGCGSHTFCDEFAEDEKMGEVEVWGLKALGRGAKRADRKDTDV